MAVEKNDPEVDVNATLPADASAAGLESEFVGEDTGNLADADLLSETTQSVEPESEAMLDVDSDLSSLENEVSDLQDDLTNVPESMDELAEEVEGVEELEELEEIDEFAEIQEELDKLRDELARARADFYNLTQQYSAYVKRSKEDAVTHKLAGQIEVCEALLAVLDDIEAARQHGDLESGPLAAIATKLEGILRTRFGLEKFGEAGQEFDPNSHEALMASSSADVQVPLVKEVFQAGYQINDRVLRPAKVAVENPE